MCLCHHGLKGILSPYSCQRLQQICPFCTSGFFQHFQKHISTFLWIRDLIRTCHSGILSEQDFRTVLSFKKNINQARQVFFTHQMFKPSNSGNPDFIVFALCLDKNNIHMFLCTPLRQNFNQSHTTKGRHFFQNFGSLRYNLRAWKAHESLFHSLNLISFIGLQKRQ